MQYHEYFINSAVWTVLAVLLAWCVASGTLSRFEAGLAAAVVAWPFALFYCRRCDGPFGLLLKLYALAPLAIAPLAYFGLL